MILPAQFECCWLPRGIPSVPQWRPQPLEDDGEACRQASKCQRCGWPPWCKCAPVFTRAQACTHMCACTHPLVFCRRKSWRPVTSISSSWKMRWTPRLLSSLPCARCARTGRGAADAAYVTITLLLCEALQLLDGTHGFLRAGVRACVHVHACAHELCVWVAWSGGVQGEGGECLFRQRTDCRPQKRLLPALRPHALWSLFLWLCPGIFSFSLEPCSSRRATYGASAPGGHFPR